MDVDRLELVRRLLGAATQLFLEDADPISVHCLAASACEHAEHAAQESAEVNFKSHAMVTFPDIAKGELKQLRNKYWTVIKHSHDRRGDPFDVSARLADFDDSDNDPIVFVAWYDFMMCGRPIPLAAQVFQLWFFRVYPASLNPESDFDFPKFDGISRETRKPQKRILKEAISDAFQMPELVSDPCTDMRPLILP